MMTPRVSATDSTGSCGIAERRAVPRSELPRQSSARCSQRAGWEAVFFEGRSLEHSRSPMPNEHDATYLVLHFQRDPEYS